MNSHEEKLMIELGYISIAFSNFDYLIHEINSSLISNENHKIGNYISGRLATHARVDLFKELLQLIPFEKQLVDMARSNVKEFIEEKNKRNKFIHHIWHTKEDDSFVDVLIDKQLFLGKIDSDWTNADEINLDELIRLKENLQTLVMNQVQINMNIENSYRMIILEERKNKDQISSMFKDGTLYSVGPDV